MSDTVIGILGVLAAILGLPFAYAAWKGRELRQDEVLDWSNECIDVLQRTRLAVGDAANGRRAEDFAAVVAELRARSATQVERGRLFFRNVPGDEGGDKESAYQGKRPVILDCLVANAEICRRAPDAGDAELKALALLASRFAKRFVSLAQDEVGRSRRSKSQAEGAGSSVDIDADIAKFTSAAEPGG